MAAEARSARRTGDDRTGVHQRLDISGSHRLLEDVLASGRDDEPRTTGDLLTLDDLGRDGEVAQPAIGTRSDERLVDVLSHSVGDGSGIPSDKTGFDDLRLYRGEVDVIVRS